MRTFRAPFAGAAVVLATVLATVLAGCGRDTKAGEKIAVTATDTECQVAKTALAAGTYTFSVTNKGSKVTEFYLYGKGGKVEGEVEDISPNVTRDLNIELKAGEYEAACKPGMKGDGIRVKITVTGQAKALADDPALGAAVAAYRSYVATEADALLARTTEFVAAVKAGDVAAAKALFPVARTHWERIEPVAESFGDLDPAIDAREDDVEAGAEWTGFHRIEKDLWVTGQVGADGPIADRLLTDVREIVSRSKTVELSPIQLGNGAKELLDEVATGKITGEEDRYSHTDLWDFAANLAGARQAVEVLRTALTARDGGLVGTLDARFSAVDAVLGKHRSGTGWRLHNELTPAELKELSDAINALAEPVSRIAAEREGGGSGGTAWSRRRALAVGGAGLAGLATGGAVGALTGHAPDGAAATADAAAAVPFFGEHQAGIVTAAPDRLHFVAFDVITDRRADLVDLLRTWTAAAARMTAGRDSGPVGAVGGAPEAPPDDTGEALGLPPSGLTLTVGLGPGLFRDAAGRDRFGIAERRPAALADLPHFPADALDAAISGGDLCVQACANDPQVAVHAVRNLARLGFGTVSVRWSQLGFGRTSSTSRGQATPRNLFGFKDGTENLKAEDADLLREHVWVPSADGPEWMVGGSYLVSRKIRMMVETWDRTSLAEQEMIIGRHKGSGAPLGGGAEFDRVDLAATGSDGAPTVPVDAHVRLAHPDPNGGARMLRRGYNYVDGSDGLGRLSAGLFFLAYQRDPRRQFVAIQRRLAAHDAMNEYVRHVSSGLFACPPGVRSADDFWGRALFS